MHDVRPPAWRRSCLFRRSSLIDVDAHRVPRTSCSTCRPPDDLPRTCRSAFERGAVACCCCDASRGSVLVVSPAARPCRSCLSPLSRNWPGPPTLVLVTTLKCFIPPPSGISILFCFHTPSTLNLPLHFTSTFHPSPSFLPMRVGLHCRINHISCQLHPSKGPLYTRGQMPWKEKSKTLVDIPCFEGLFNGRPILSSHDLWKPCKAGRGCILDQIIFLV